MARGLIIPADVEQPLEEREFAQLEYYQAAVGGWIESVDLPTLGVTLYVNEEGLIRHLPFNSRASFLWWYHVPEARQKAMLVGDAVLVGMPDRNGDSTDLPTRARKLLLTPHRYRLEVRTFGDPNWYRDQATYPDYWEAIVWAMVLLERIPTMEEVRVVPVKLNQVNQRDA
ncbi:DUF3846 domain-containing protein [Microbacterium sp. ASV81]|uniref:DUF3846 domain-containing protein n=1 Tax=Microbacterium capsulatum TaxID=3041921 RepID=A0ABU0XF44_9MICO|nr:DUF3846 domain-containing protein [Microbacterium sp. ASV81]MDQ4213731.1 DUF3846 domain-containing protein [Microbacterium sp. ASV81]